MVVLVVVLVVVVVVVACFFVFVIHFVIVFSAVSIIGFLVLFWTPARTPNSPRPLPTATLAGSPLADLRYGVPGSPGASAAAKEKVAMHQGAPSSHPTIDRYFMNTKIAYTTTC